ncbi:DUF1707 SHOCT-like domain-containing protein [Pseudonocardia asaccharolytica]|uniref:DUF1707 domain-containing protein n=1 Tax=Pseudonocardia asaccharolytica DSM 44247 = NBRC 16224 TaxID=1123024 RepID=A0A511CZ11_9PSEU|nr:DUF1707 domain-containing protein [Pseudonocardia asaccharolytica]GEL16494.1 hypothetical protein PA7_03310 [Pseudonocardia asaccharolytica DSM 44247 = NBRC 16224]
MSLQPPSGDSRGIRISDADRERAAQRLHQALAEGRITVAELEERLAAVYAARFGADLVPPLEDLPGDPLDVTGSLPVSSTPAGPPVVLRAGMGGLRRTGVWQVPARLRVHSGMGSVLLDFCDAELPHPVVEVELQLGAGSARLLVPDGATADVDGLVAGMGTVRSKVPATPVPGHPHFRVYGRSGMGSVTVRHRYRFAGITF